MHLAQMAMNYLRRVIPEEIMQRAFISPTMLSFNKTYSLDAIVIQEVIRGQVFEDCNMVGGTEVVIALNGIDFIYHDNYSLSFTIPRNRTDGRTIMRVLSISYGQGQAQGFAAYSMTASVPLLEAGQQLVNSNSSIPSVSTAYIRLIGDNTVLVQDNVSLPAYTYLRCVLENERDFGNIPQAYYTTFYKLVEQAAKAMIYTRLVLKQERGFIHGGAALGEMKAIIDTYADANDVYMTMLDEKWTKQSLLADPESKRRHLKMIMSSY